MLKAIIQEAAALASLALFIAMIAMRRLVLGRCVGWELKHFVFDI
jgi:hypothetical protein